MSAMGHKRAWAQFRFADPSAKKAPGCEWNRGLPQNRCTIVEIIEKISVRDNWDRRK